ncbi:hypothetical protein [Corynebacterium hesseae]
MASDATYPLLDSADAEKMLAYARAQAPGLSLPTDESAHIDEQINRVLADDTFLGSLEDAVPAALYLEARETLRVAAGTIKNVDDSFTIAALGALTGQPSLVAAGYTRVARAWLDHNDTEEAEKFAAKAAAAGDDTALNEIAAARIAASHKDFSESAPASVDASADANSLSSSFGNNVSLAELQERLESAKSGEAKAHAAEFVAINDAVTAGEFDGAGSTMGDILRTILESAVGALWASDSAADCERVAAQSFTILSNARADEEYQQLPAPMLARFYSDAAQHSAADVEQRVACFAAAAREYQCYGDLDGELRSILKTVTLDVQHRAPEEAYDILASRYVDSLKLQSLPVSAKWTVLYSESLLLQAQDMYKSTQVLLNFLDRHPDTEATTPSEHNALAEVAELLGDRHASTGKADLARSMYFLAYNLFEKAHNVRALEELRKKA